MCIAFLQSICYTYTHKVPAVYRRYAHSAKQDRIRTKKVGQGIAIDHRICYSFSTKLLLHVELLPPLAYFGVEKLFYGKQIGANTEIRKLCMKGTAKRLWNALTTVLVALVVLAAILLAGVRLIGFQVFTVLSGSMEPTYPTGSLLYVKAVDTQTLQEGDVITFLLDEDTVATHRIVEVLPDEQDVSVIRYRTKGDANNAPDGVPVHYRNIIGSPVFSIPGLGYVANAIQKPPGTYIAIVVGALLMLLVFLPDLFSSKKNPSVPAQEGAVEESPAIEPVEKP